MRISFVSVVNFNIQSWQTSVAVSGDLEQKIRFIALVMVKNKPYKIVKKPYL